MNLYALSPGQLAIGGKWLNGPVFFPEFGTRQLARPLYLQDNFLVNSRKPVMTQVYLSGIHLNGGLLQWGPPQCGSISMGVHLHGFHLSQDPPEWGCTSWRFHLRGICLNGGASQCRSIAVESTTVGVHVNVGLNTRSQDASKCTGHCNF